MFLSGSLIFLRTLVASKLVQCFLRPLVKGQNGFIDFENQFVPSKHILYIYTLILGQQNENLPTLIP